MRLLQPAAIIAVPVILADRHHAKGYTGPPLLRDQSQRRTVLGVVEDIHRRMREGANPRGDRHPKRAEILVRNSKDVNIG